MAGLVAGGFAVGAVILRENAFAGRIDVGEGLRQRILDITVRLNDSAFGYAALPFQPFVDLIVADRMTTAKAGLATAAFGTVTALAAALIALYTVTSRRVAERERRNYRPNGAARGVIANSTRNETAPTIGPHLIPRLRHLPHWGGAGALAWRQLVGARRHWGSLLTAMIAPAVFAGAPCFVIADPHVAFLAATCTLAFYSFLLLPTALRFDFRRDLDRLATLKGLPITPAAAVIGQTLAPVLIATLFQSVVLAFAAAARSLPAHLLFMAILVMIPLNTLVFGLENLIYLLYPYRVQQEGLEIFLRTMLNFTGKGLLFAVGLEAMAIWGFAAAHLTRAASHWTGSPVNGYLVFIGGMVAGPSVLASASALRIIADLSPHKPR